MDFEIKKGVLKEYRGTGKTVVIPKEVTRIGKGAFFGCKSLISVVIPDGVTSIGDEAFIDCTILTSVTIPDGVTSIGWKAFENCTNLPSITVPDGVTSISCAAFEDCRNLTSITIPDSVKKIDNYAFSGCTNLTSITIPDSVTSIGAFAFWCCTRLTRVTIPDSVTSIGRSAFGGCAKLKKATIPERLNITNGAFELYTFIKRRKATKTPKDAGKTKAPVGGAEKSTTAKPAAPSLTQKQQKLIKAASVGNVRSIVKLVGEARKTLELNDFSAAYAMLLGAEMGYRKLNEALNDDKLKQEMRFAYTVLSEMNRLGTGTGKSRWKEIDFAKEAALLGNVDKAFDAAELCHGKEAEKWYSFAADRGHEKAADKLGELLYEQKDYSGALGYLTVSAEKGSVAAKLMLAEMYSEDLGTEKAPDKALPLYQAVFESGDQSVALKLARLLLDSERDSRDIDKAEEYLKTAADNKNAEAYALLVPLYKEKKDYEALWEIIENRSELGIGGEEYLIGAAYELVRYYADNNVHEERIIPLLELAAEKGYKDSEGLLGIRLYEEEDSYRYYFRIAGLLEGYSEKNENTPNKNKITGILADMYYKGGSGLKPDRKKALDYYQSIADGDGESEYMAGMILYKGDFGAEKNYLKALGYLETAYRSGTEDHQIGAALMIGSIYHKGDDTVAANKELALRWYELAAELGSREAAAALGRSYFVGELTGRDRLKAIYYYEHSDDRSVERKLCTAYCRYCGLGLAEDKALACRILTELDKKELDTDSVRILFELYSEGKAIEYVSDSKRLSEEERAIAYRQCKTDAARYALMLVEKGTAPDEKMKQAFLDCILELSDKKDKESMILLGDCAYLLAKNSKYARSKLFDAAYYCDEKNIDPKRQFKWYSRLNVLGSIAACTNLGVCYGTGKGTKKDYSKAFECYTKAANAGSNVAQRTLGYYYMKGLGCSQDYEKAFEWLGRSADNGQKTAASLLIELAEKCRQDDYELSIKCYEKAAEHGIKSAREYLAKNKAEQFETALLVKFAACNLWESRVELYNANKAEAEAMLTICENNELKEIMKLIQLDETLSGFAGELYEMFTIDEKWNMYTEKGYCRSTENDQYTDTIVENFGDDGEEIYNMALRLEENGRKFCAIIGYYCAAKLGSQNALATLANMSNERSDYFLGRE